MRKTTILSLIIVLCLSLLTMSNAFADEEIIRGELSEYDYLVSLKEMSAEELKEGGFTDEEVKTIEDLDFEKMALEIKEIPDEELIGRGITLDDIKIIRNTDDVGLILSKSLGNVTYNVSKVNFKKQGSNTYLKTKTTWNWSTSPTLQLIDIMATYTSDNFTKSSTSGSVTYYELGGNGVHESSTVFTNFTRYAGRISCSRFPMNKVYPSSSNPSVDKRYYAKKGTIYNEWLASGNITVVGIACKYGHSTISCTPSVSASVNSLSFSFTPSLSVTTGDEVYHQITRS